MTDSRGDEEGYPEGVDAAQLARLLRAADELISELDHDITRSGYFRPPLIYRRRVKKEREVLRKIRRKRDLRPLAAYGLADVQDIIGVRFVTKLRQDIPGVVENIFRLLTGDERYHSTLFRACTVADYRQYTRAQTNINAETGERIDPLWERLDALPAQYFTESVPPVLQLDTKPQYSSVHVVLIHPSDLEGMEVPVPVEIQIRSVFEEAWSEIDHMIFYRVDREGALVAREKREAARQHLGILKSMLDTADDYATLIVETDLDRQGGPPPSIKKSLDGSEYVEKITHPLTAHRPLLDEFASLVREKDRLDADTTAGTRSLRYVVLADQFLDLLTRLRAVTSESDFPGHEDRYQSVVFLVSMEEALCRLLSGIRAQLPKAKEAYQSIVSIWPNYPTSWFRLAQCHMLMMEHSEDVDIVLNAEQAFTAYETSRKLLDRTPASEELIISPGQRQYLHENIERLQGFVLWRLVDKRRRANVEPTFTDLQHLTRAWDVATNGLRRLPRPLTVDGIKLLNSAVYYGLEALELGERFPDQRLEMPSSQAIRDLFQELYQAAEAANVTDPNTWHTIMRVAGRIGDLQRVAYAAGRVVDAHALEDVVNASLYERESHQRAFREAWAIYRAPPPPA